MFEAVMICALTVGVLPDEPVNWAMMPVRETLDWTQLDIPVELQMDLKTDLEGDSSTTVEDKSNKAEPPRIGGSVSNSYTLESETGEEVVLVFEQPVFPKTESRFDLSSGSTFGPDVGCRASSCGMCMLNSLANHGQSYEYLKTLSPVEQMRLHYKLHNVSGFEGVPGEVQRISGSIRQVPARQGLGQALKNLFGR